MHYFTSRLLHSMTSVTRERWMHYFTSRLLHSMTSVSRRAMHALFHQPTVTFYVTISTYNAHTEPLLKNLRILKIQDILILQTLKMYHKHRNNKLPTYIQNWPLQANKEIHHHKTRHADELHTHRTLHMFAEKCLRYNVIRVVNNSPLCI